VAILREIGDRRGEGNALGNLASAYAMLGDSHRALDLYQQRMVIARETGDRAGVAEDSWSLGKALEQSGDLQRATDLMQIRVDYERAIDHLDVEKHAAYLEYLRQRLAAGESEPVAGEGHSNLYRSLQRPVQRAYIPGDRIFRKLPFTAK